MKPDTGLPARLQQPSGESIGTMFFQNWPSSQGLQTVLNLSTAPALHLLELVAKVFVQQETQETARCCNHAG